MDTSWRRKDLPDIVRALSQRPGHEGVRTLLAEILRHAFGAGYLDLDHEVRLPEVHGRVDTLFGATVFEFKRDLRREMPDVEARLPDYLAERERQTGRRYLGIATDGAGFVAFELRDGRLVRLDPHATKPEDVEAPVGFVYFPGPHRRSIGSGEHFGPPFATGLGGGRAGGISVPGRFARHRAFHRQATGATGIYIYSSIA